MNRAPGPDFTPPDLPGYRFIKLIGAGGNAQVYLYEQDLPRRQVAVKVLNESVRSEAARRRFIAEANVTAGLQHRHIVQLFDAKVTGDGRPCLVMPYYPMPNLALRARRSHFPVAEVLRVGIQIGSAVETSHRAGVLHRDIKPQNILIDPYGEPALTDFGIATTQGDGPEGMSVPWSPPELLFGSGPGDQRSDVYSLGATLWHLLVGRSPFEYPGDSSATSALTDRIERDPPPRTQRADVPESLERLLRQALAKDPAARPQTAMELIHGLQSVEQELRLPVTQPVLSGDQLPADTFDAGTQPREAVPSGETTQRRAPGEQPGQPPWGGDDDATVTREPRTGGARLTTAAGYDPAWGATGQWPGPGYETGPWHPDGRRGPGGPGYPDGPWSAGAPGRAGRRARAGSRRAATISGGVALLAAAAVVAVLSLSPGRSVPSAAPAGNVQSIETANSTVTSGSSVAAASSVTTPTVTAGTSLTPGQGPGAPAPGPGSQGTVTQRQSSRAAPGTSVHSSPQSAVTAKSATTGSSSSAARPITSPTVTATANGTTITYTWSAQSDGVAETLQVCIAGACTSYPVPATGGYSGSTATTYGNGQTETITAHLTDTTGQSSATATASATTSTVVTSPPPPASPAVSVSEGSSTTRGSGTCSGVTCYFFNVTAASFPAGTTLSYTCADQGGVWWGPTSQTESGSTTTNSAGTANFETICLHTNDGETVTIAVSGGGKSAAGSYKT